VDLAVLRPDGQRSALPSRDKLRALAGTLALAAVLPACGSSGHEKVAVSHGAPAHSPAWSERYQRALRPSLLFLGVERLAFEEGRLIGSCMQERGWRRYPLPKSDRWLSLETAQSVALRRRLAATYGERLLTRNPLDGLDAFRRFGDWLHEQPYWVRNRYLKDISGLHADEDAPDAGSCKWLANRRLRANLPASVPAVESRAGQLYEKYVTGTKAYRMAQRAWRVCMRRRGYPRAGDPLTVWRPGLLHLLDHAEDLRPEQKRKLARSLSAQALAEHACSVEHLDDVVQRGDRRVVRALAASFPNYRRRLTD
jgi:hypothetical protein